MQDCSIEFTRQVQGGGFWDFLILLQARPTASAMMATHWGQAVEPSKAMRLCQTSCLASMFHKPVFSTIKVTQVVALAEAQPTTT